MHDGNVLYMAGVGYVENMKLQKGDYPAIHTYTNDKRRQLAQRIRFVKTEYKGEPVFGIICDHERQVTGQRSIGKACLGYAGDGNGRGTPEDVVHKKEH